MKWTKVIGTPPFRIHPVWFLFLLAAGLIGCATGQGRHDPGDPDPESGILSLYQRIISPIDGDRCPMVPSCSAYARDAVRQHGWFLGWIVTCERLIRCGRDETRLSPAVITNGRIRTWDPVPANDWQKKEPSP